jgi:hypothetical protein
MSINDDLVIILSSKIHISHMIYNQMSATIHLNGVVACFQFAFSNDNAKDMCNNPTYRGLGKQGHHGVY